MDKTRVPNSNFTNGLFGTFIMAVSMLSYAGYHEISVVNLDRLEKMAEKDPTENGNPLSLLISAMGLDKEMGIPGGDHKYFMETMHAQHVVKSISESFKATNNDSGHAIDLLSFFIKSFNILQEDYGETEDGYEDGYHEVRQRMIVQAVSTFFTLVMEDMHSNKERADFLTNFMVGTLFKGDFDTIPEDYDGEHITMAFEEILSIHDIETKQVKAKPIKGN